MSSAGMAWQVHAQAAETALSRGDPGLARQELHRAIQSASSAPGGKRLPKIRQRPGPDDADDDEDYEVDQGAWLEDLRAALEQAEMESSLQQQPFNKMIGARVNDTSREPLSTHLVQPEDQASSNALRDIVQNVIEDLGISESSECSAFVMSILEDIELELEQGETREQMLADVLRSAADLAPKIEEDGVNDAVIADNIEQAVQRIVDSWNTSKRKTVPAGMVGTGKDARTTGGKVAKKTHAKQAWVEGASGKAEEMISTANCGVAEDVIGSGANAANGTSEKVWDAGVQGAVDSLRGPAARTEGEVRVRRPKKKGVSRWVQSKREQLIGSATEGVGSRASCPEAGPASATILAPMDVESRARAQGMEWHGQRHKDLAGGQTAGEDSHYRESTRREAMMDDAVYTAMIEAKARQNNKRGEARVLSSEHAPSATEKGRMLVEAKSKDRQGVGKRESEIDRPDVVCSFWGIERVDMPTDLRYKGELTQRISDRAFSRQVIEGNVSLLMALELRARKKVDRLAGTGVGMASGVDRGKENKRQRRSSGMEEELMRSGVLLTAKERHMDREREREREKTSGGAALDPGSKLEAYQDLLLDFRRVHELAANVGFSGFEGSIARSLARASAALNLKVEAMLHWREAETLASKERDRRLEIRALIGCAECFCGARDFAEADRRVAAALALVETSTRVLEEEDRLCILRASVQVQDLQVSHKLKAGERDLIANRVPEALQHYQMAAGAALRGLEVARELGGKQRTEFAKRKAQREREAEKSNEPGTNGGRSRSGQEGDGGTSGGVSVLGHGGANWAAQVEDYNATQLCKITRRLSKSRYRALAASACCLMKDGHMSKAIDVWDKVLQASESLSSETAALEGKVVSLENLAVAHEVLGSLQVAEAFANKARHLRARLESSHEGSDSVSEGQRSGVDVDSRNSRKAAKSSTCVCC